MRYLRLLGKIALVGVVLAILGMIFVYWRSNQLLVRDRAEMPAHDAGLAALAA